MTINGNQITIVGNLTADPELRFTQTGRPVANIRVASSYRYQQNNEWTEQTSFFSGTVWGDEAENVAASLKKGDRVMLTGRMQSRDYEHEGQKRTAWDVIIDAVGPELRWARAEVERVHRDHSGDRTPAMAGGGGGHAPDPVYGEEPF